MRLHYARGDDEARALLQEGFTLSGDLQITANTLHVRLDPPGPPDAARPRRTLCRTQRHPDLCYPGTALAIAYTVKSHPVSA